MTLRSACRRTAVGLLLLSTGCVTASTGRDSVLSRLTASRSDQAARDLPAQDEPESEDAEPEPKVSKPDIRQASQSAARGPRQLDTATLMLIQQELSDCSTTERDQWMSYLQSIDPIAVPHVLQARKMQAARTAQSQLAVSQHSDPTPAEPTFGHSPLANPLHAPQLGFDSFDAGSGFAATAAGPGTPLSAPEPRITPENTAGVSPFGRHADRPPMMQTGFGTGQAGIDARMASTAAFPQSDPTQTQMPAINPNLARDVAVTGAPFAPGFVEPTPGIHVGPAAGFPPLGPAGDTATLQGAYWQDALQRLTALVEAEIAASQPGLSDVERIEYTKRQVWLRMLYLMAQQPERAQSAIPGLVPAEQEFWTALFWAVSNYFDTQSLRDAPERAAVTLEQLDYAQDRLQRIAALQLKNLSFCYRINSFGNIETAPRDEFRPGQTVLLYAEVANFESRPHADGRFTTRLKSFIEIRRGSVDGQVIESNALAPTEDVCRSIRHDYFHSYTIDLPQHLTAGPYTLVLRVEDEFSGKAALHPIGFLIR